MLSSHIIFDEPLAKYTTFGIGGPAQCMVFPKNRDDLCTLLKYAYDNKIPAIFIGSGSNLLVWDEGFNGFVLSLRKTFNKQDERKNDGYWNIAFSMNFGSSDYSESTNNSVLDTQLYIYINKNNKK